MKRGNRAFPLAVINVYRGIDLYYINNRNLRNSWDLFTIYFSLT